MIYDFKKNYRSLGTDNMMLKIIGVTSLIFQKEFYFTNNMMVIPTLSLHKTLLPSLEQEQISLQLVLINLN